MLEEELLTRELTKDKGTKLRLVSLIDELLWRMAELDEEGNTTNSAGDGGGDGIGSSLGDVTGDAPPPEPPKQPPIWKLLLGLEKDKLNTRPRKSFARGAPPFESESEDEDDDDGDTGFDGDGSTTNDGSATASSSVS